MNKAVCVTYSELFGQQPTLDGLIGIISRLPLRHAVFVLSRLNSAMRYGMQEQGRESFGRIQEALLVWHLDDETLQILKDRLPNARCAERPIFVPLCILTVLRLAIIHCDQEHQPNADEDAFVRHTIGIACLMSNDLLFTAADQEALLSGTKDDQTIELMVQMMASFELTNTQRAEHLIARLQLMYRMLLEDPGIRSRISSRCQGFDIKLEFHTQIGVTVDRWLFIVFAIYAYYLDGANALEQKPNQTLINPEVFCGTSNITREELAIVLDTISIKLSDLKAAMLAETSTDPRYDFVSLPFTARRRICEGQSASGRPCLHDCEVSLTAVQVDASTFDCPTEAETLFLRLGESSSKSTRIGYWKGPESAQAIRYFTRH